MDVDKLMLIPKHIEHQSSKFLQKPFTKAFELLYTISKEMNQMNYFDCIKANPLINIKTIDVFENIPIRDQFLLIHHTLWECKLYGIDRCYPIRTFDEISPQIVSQINSNNKINIKNHIKMINNFSEFSDKFSEVKYLPAVFDKSTIRNLNVLFLKVYAKELSEISFVTKIKTYFDQFTLKGISVGILNGVDVLRNLFVCCTHKQNILKLKKNGLPYSSPSIPTSPKFLQVLTDCEFREYFRPLGMENKNKQFRSWVNNFHAFMIEHKYLEKQTFIRLTLINCDKELEQFSNFDKNHLTCYIKKYYKFIN